MQTPRITLKGPVHVLVDPFTGLHISLKGERPRLKPALLGTLFTSANLAALAADRMLHGIPQNTCGSRRST